eukprot:TRINITY_DN17700_c0_g1_i1.p2 TRINITY_DN17700_c0_g1~~TRINITY_DN17700_c0_g1_i1.p2  ORF type:complete len:234 (-),score=56.21 TRINITY_DN17700_c0_g1_i1:54-725(-)
MERGGHRRPADSPDVHLSKQMSYLLRHGAVKEGLPIREDGFVLLDDLLRALNAGRAKCTELDVQRVVGSNDKQRFLIREVDGLKMIRANQGHSIEVKSLELTPITDAANYQYVVHGTYKMKFASIKQNGLSKMKRQHVHCAKGLAGSTNVISGMRSSCDALIFIDVAQALADGLKFFLSANGVVLCESVPPKYFKYVVGRDFKPFDAAFPAVPSEEFLQHAQL